MSRLNYGYSTGSCAAGAAKAAAMLLGGRTPGRLIDIPLPDGTRLGLPLAFAEALGDSARAGVRKDGGDDPDITHGVIVISSVQFEAGTGVRFEAGDGVGTVTLPGLSVPPGEPAINPVPRRMIEAAIGEVTDRGVRIIVSIPGGSELAAKTFNPKLGIAGGLSILGTTGRVRPFSLEAMREALCCGLDVAVASGFREPVLVPGNVGERAARRHLRVAEKQVVDVGNEWGALLDRAQRHGVRRLLALGHPGKLAKLPLGDWDTHSSRSQTALSSVAGLAHSLSGIDFSALPTVEGIFMALAPEQRRSLGCDLARRIQSSIATRLGEGFEVAVALVNMAGDWLGEAGDLSAWK
jgi:cobalt-precorrin-5B (C1)-methyltransferase